MALFVDGPACTIEDLTDQDAGLLEVSLVSNINLSTKLRLAVEEIETDLQLWLNRPRPTLELVWGSTLHVNQIVVTAPLKRWETMHALALAYRDAYFSQLVDRYQAKWKEYAGLARGARENFIASGFALVSEPIDRATPPILSTTPGPQSGGTFYACVTWVNAAGQEGAPSAPASITVGDGNLMTVGVNKLPVCAQGFNVYAGTEPAEIALQNDVALPATSTFLYVPGQTSGGKQPGNGQRPDFMRPIVRTLLRG